MIVSFHQHSVLRISVAQLMLAPNHGMGPTLASPKHACLDKHDIDWIGIKKAYKQRLLAQKQRTEICKELRTSCGKFYLYLIPRFAWREE